MFCSRDNTWQNTPLFCSIFYFYFPFHTLLHRIEREFLLCEFFLIASRFRIHFFFSWKLALLFFSFLVLLLTSATDSKLLDFFFSISYAVKKDFTLVWRMMLIIPYQRKIKIVMLLNLKMLLISEIEFVSRMPSYLPWRTARLCASCLRIWRRLRRLTNSSIKCNGSVFSVEIPSMT